ncbi:MAG: sulfotransferase family 2 domain-containing protein [Pseudomonadota bacterium]
MIVSHAHRFIFLRTEKTGGTSLAQALYPLLGEGDLRPGASRPAWARWSPIHHGALMRQVPDLFGLHGHATAAQVRRVIGAKTFDSYTKFAVERNPWDRQVSLYTHRQWKRGRGPEHFAADMASAWYRNTEYCRLNNWAIYAIGSEVVADQVIDYDRLAEDLPPLLSRLGLPAVALPRARAYNPDRPHYSAYYDEAARARVARWYSREIEAFGYRFETAPAQPETETIAARPAA